MALLDILQVVFVSRRIDQIGLNVRHYLVGAETGTGATHGEIATVLFDAFAPLYQALLVNDAEFRGVSVQRIRPIPPTVAIGSGQAAVPGLRPGQALPTQTAGIISLATPFAGRAFRGRMYIPFPSEDDNNVDASPSPVYVTALVALGGEVMDTQVIVGAGGTSTLVPGVFHRVQGTITNIIGGVANDAWATQRRRGAYGRQNPVAGGGGTPIG